MNSLSYSSFFFENQLLKVITIRDFANYLQPPTNARFQLRHLRSISDSSISAAAVDNSGELNHDNQLSEVGSANYQLLPQLWAAPFLTVQLSAAVFLLESSPFHVYVCKLLIPILIGFPVIAVKFANHPKSCRDSHCSLLESCLLHLHHSIQAIVLLRRANIPATPPPPPQSPSSSSSMAGRGSVLFCSWSNYSHNGYIKSSSSSSSIYSSTPAMRRT